MKNYEWKYDLKKRKDKKYHKEQKAQGFRCAHCKQHILINDYMGTANRNHCNYCLWSKHVDRFKPGDRLEICCGGMKPIGLAFKDEGRDKYGNRRNGEIKIIHQCIYDYKISTNRIAADDCSSEILNLFNQSLSLGSQLRKMLINQEIELLDQSDSGEIKIQLFGR